MPAGFHHPTGRALILILCALGPLAACEDDQISQYHVPRDPIIGTPHEGHDHSVPPPPNPDAAAVPPMMAPPLDPNVPERTLAAMVEHGPSVWFFKIRGPDAPVASQSQTFESFLRSLQFPPLDDQQSIPPTWALPDGWTQQTGDPGSIRFATITIPNDDAPLELTVVPLSLTAGDVFANVNRWRNELNLEPVTPDQLPAVTQQIIVAGQTITLVNFASGDAPTATP
ncbi:MAG: hypothetical protein CMJ49_14055 [Planctomycetaceae bacterium]|nr:hypothetical protein [Planctomycetaceae bacterium]